MLRLLQATGSSLLRYGTGLIIIAAALLLVYPNLARNLFATGTELGMFMPHGYCYYWVPSLVILHVLSDSIIGFSYVAISLTLAYLVHRARRDIPFHWIFVAFGLFIVACGATHFMEIITVWHATYWLSGYVKLITAAASLATAVVLPSIVPKTLEKINDVKAFAAQKAELERINRELRDEAAKHRQTEQALRDSEERFQEFMKYAPVSVFIKQADGRMVYVNPTFEKTFNLKAEDIYGKNDFELWTREIAETARKTDLNVLENNRMLESNVSTLLPGDTLRHWLSFKFPLEDSNGARFLAGMSLDITERKLAEEKLLRLSSIVESSDDAIISKDLDGNILSWNKGAEQLFGYSSEEALGRHISFLIPSGRENEEPRIMEKVKSGESVKYYETVRAGKSGELIDLSLTISPIRNAAGEITGASKIAHDITRRRRAEEELKSFNLKLKNSNAELQDFASIASHDLQEPLRKVQAFGDRLKIKCGDTLDAEALDYLNRMQNAAGRMQTLINDLLTLSRITIQAQPFVPVDLQRIAGEVVSDLETLIETTDGRVEIKYLPVIDADPTQMRQLLQNLIGNALKFHRPDESPLVKISGQIVGGDVSGSAINPVYRLTIEDNGIGFDNRNAEKIFKVFHRLHGRSEYEGTGIGLAVCRRIVERHGGAISARSVPSEGTVFIVELPVNHHKEMEK